VEAHPRGVAEAGTGRADVGVAVVRVDAPGVQDPLDVAVVARPADVVHDLVVAALAERPRDAAADVGERLVPAHLLPAALAALPDAAHRVEDALRVADLVERGRALGAVAAPAGGMQRVALELGDLAGLLVDPGDEPAV